MPPEHHLTAQVWTGDVSECAGWVRGQGEAGRKVRCSMQSTRLGARIFTIQVARDKKINV